jgi:hypothetical protein
MFSSNLKEAKQEEIVLIDEGEGALRLSGSNNHNNVDVYRTFLRIFHYIYCDNLDGLPFEHPDEAIELLSLVEMYSLGEPLKLICLTEIINYIEVDNAAYLYAIGSLYQAEKLK